MGSSLKIVLASCLLVAVCQLAFGQGPRRPSGLDARTHSYAGRGILDSILKNKTTNNITNQVDKENERPTRYYHNSRAAGKEEDDQPKWKPNTDPSHFHFKVMDNIKGADQFREEKVENGEVNGYWAVPMDDTGKLWKKTVYRAGKDGFHIVEEKTLPREELTGGVKTNEDEASVDIDQLGGQTAYTVKGSDLKKQQQQQQQQRVARGYGV